MTTKDPAAAKDSPPQSPKEDKYKQDPPERSDASTAPVKYPASKGNMTEEDAKRQETLTPRPGQTSESHGGLPPKAAPPYDEKKDIEERRKADERLKQLQKSIEVPLGEGSEVNYFETAEETRHRAEEKEAKREEQRPQAQKSK